MVRRIQPPSQYHLLSGGPVRILTIEVAGCKNSAGKSDVQSVTAELQSSPD